MPPQEPARSLRRYLLTQDGLVRPWMLLATLVATVGLGSIAPTYFILPMLLILGGLLLLYGARKPLDPRQGRAHWGWGHPFLLLGGLFLILSIVPLVYLLPIAFVAAFALLLFRRRTPSPPQ